jgi:integrase
MAKIKLRYVQGWLDRKDGVTYYYVRRRGFRLVRLRGLPGSQEFMASYQRALDQAPLKIGAKHAKAGSVSDVIARYFDSMQYFGALALATRRMRRPILERFRIEYGDLPLAVLPPKLITLQLGRMPPHAARTWLKTIRHLAQFAKDNGIIRVDPTVGIKTVVPKSDGHHTWTEEEIAAFERAHPIGTKARLAMALALYTAQRRGDLVRLRPTDIVDGVLRLKQNKTRTPLALPVHPELRRAVAAMPPGGKTLLITDRAGHAYNADDFSARFRDWCNEAGLPSRCNVHGLRKAACRRLAEAGCTAHEIKAISGHKSLKEVERYTEAVSQAKMARSAMDKIGGGCQGPAGKVSSSARKPYDTGVSE